MNLLKSLVNYYDRLSRNGSKIPLEGYSKEVITAEVLISASGAFKGLNLLNSADPKEKSMKIVPSFMEPRGNSSDPYFLWDKTEYSLGLTWDKKKKKILSDDGRKYFSEFCDYQENLLSNVTDKRLTAFLAFIRRWKPENYESMNIDSEIWKKVIDCNVIFHVDGIGYVHDSAEGRDIWNNYLTNIRYMNKETLTGTCSITGEENVRIARLHPKIKGVRGAQSSGANLISYNSDIYNSFGKTKGNNAPISEMSAFKYSTALNYLLEKDSEQKISIGKSTTIVFWAESDDGDSEKSADAIEKMLSKANNFKNDSDQSDVQKLINSMQALSEGRMDRDLVPDVGDKTIINILAISPNQARLSVRYWHRGSFGDIAKSLVDHWNDLEFSNKEMNGWKHPPSIWALLRETALNGDISKISPVLSGELLNSILTGKQYPRNFIQAILQRTRSEGLNFKPSNKLSKLEWFNKRDAARRKASICKAYAVRYLQHQNMEIDIMKLNTENTLVPYLLGRLFACFVYAEKSYTERSASTADKFFSSAASTPRRILSILMKRYLHNKSALMKSNEKKGFGIKVENVVREIMNKFNGEMDDFPKIMSLEDQTLFATGYYHQYESLYESKQKDSNDQPDDTSDSE